MSKDVRFWRNVTLIGLAHVAVIYGLIRWNRESKSANTQSIVWMNGGAGEGASSAPRGGSAPKPFKAVTSTPEPSPARTEETEDDRPVLTSAKSDIQLPTPKPTIKPKPRPTPKKIILAKASPTPSPKPKPSPEESADNDQETEAEAGKKNIAKAALARSDGSDNDSTPKKAIAAQTASGKAGSAGAPGHAGGAGGESQFGWYGSMLHDRFYSEWVQPTAVASSGAK